MAQRNFWDDDQGGHFEVTIQIPGSDPRLRSGLTTQVVIAGDTRKDVLSIPRQAIFLNNNKRVVYVKNGNGFEAKEIKVLAETESRSAIEGVSAGTEVAFVNPTEQKRSTASAAAGPALAGGPH